jgi:hypothetical protein
MALQKKFYQDTVSGLFYLEGNVIPKGNYNLLFYENDTVVSLVDFTDNKILLEPTEIINILKENDDAYTDKVDLLTDLADFF